jgi:exosortase/archaeosortase family protein
LSDWKLARAEAFPLLFFLSAVPWPPRFEQPITSALIRWVAAATTEMLHWLGIQAQTSGGAVALQSGLVGITEACSGVRSLQAGIMFGLAMGEWFLLRPARRVFLLLVAVVLALGTNLVRTLTLTLEAERHGVAGLERVHDLVGNIIITALVLAIWMVGKLLSKKRAATGGSIVADRSRWQHFGRHLFGPVPEGLPMVAMAVLAGIFGARLLYARVEAQDQTQTAPFFMARTSEAKANRFVAIPYEIWNELRPTSGEYIRHDDAQLPGGGADCFHFFWKPSAWNRFALIHRPDICMPGVGWESSGAPEPRDLQIDGRSIKVYLFRFHRGNAKALELWGAWRNGEPVSLDYQLGQIFGTAVPPKALQLEGKRRSATEIVACSVIADGAEPAPEIALAILPSVFNYRAQ